MILFIFISFSDKDLKTHINSMRRQMGVWVNWDLELKIQEVSFIHGIVNSSVS